MDWQLLIAGIIVAAALVRIVVGAVRRVRRRDIGDCSCGCSGCALSESCRTRDKRK
ncbi:MAG: hypothetical protein K2F77_07585 [Muribaculaceae bacterium]|nr:hypothetical protein [Muribaculaceae bacterium]